MDKDDCSSKFIIEDAIQETVSFLYLVKLSYKVNQRNNTASDQGHNYTAQYIFHLTSVHEVPSKITMSTKCRCIRSKSNETLAVAVASRLHPILNIN